MDREKITSYSATTHFHTISLRLLTIDLALIPTSSTRPLLEIWDQADCTRSFPMFGNEIREEVRWRKSKDSTVALKNMPGVSIRIKFVLKDADLYSFKFE